VYIFEIPYREKKSNDPVQRAARIHSSWKKQSIADELSRSAATGRSPRTPGKSPLRFPAFDPKEASSQMLVRFSFAGFDTPPEPFLQHSAVRRNPSPFITHW